MSDKRIKEMMEMYEKQDENEELGNLDNVICAESGGIDPKTAAKLAEAAGKIIAHGGCCC